MSLNPPFRADHVGSFLRPKYLIDAREQKARGEITAEQLRAVGIAFPVFTNQGGKGEPLARIVADYAPSVTVFVDDLAWDD